MLSFPALEERFFSEETPEQLISYWSQTLALPSDTWSASGWPAVVDSYFSAVKAELSGLVNRASFYWEQLSSAYKRLKVDTTFRTAFTQDVLAATHLAFAKGYHQVEGDDATFFSNRKIYHLDQAWEWMLKIVQEGDKAIIEQLARDRWVWFAQKKQSSALKELAETMQNKGVNPGYWQARQFLALKTDTEANLQQNSVSRKKNALLKAVNDLDAFRQKNWNYFPLYPYFSQLLYAKAVASANEFELAPALLDLRKANALWAGHPNWERDWQKVSEMMKIKELELRKTIANMPYNASLNEQGQKMKRDVDIGFRKVNAFISGEEKQMVADREKAFAYNVCYRLGLDEEIIATRAEELLAGIPDRLAHYQYDPQQSATVNQQQLEQLWPTTGPLAAYQLSEVWPVIEGRAVGYFALTDLVDTELQWVDTVLSPPKDANDSKGEPPFKEWLWSWAHWKTKATAVAAALVLLLIVFQSIKHQHARHERDAAFSAIESLFSNPTTATNAAVVTLPVLAPAVERFVENAPPFGADLRLEQVATVFEEAFSQWFFSAEEYNQEDFDYYSAIYQKIQK